MRPCSSSFMFSFKRVGCVSQRLGSATFDRISAALTLETLAAWPGAGHIAFLLSELCILILQAGSRSCCRRNWFWRPGVTDLTSFWRRLHASNVAGTACCDNSFVILFFREARFCSIANRREPSQIALSAMMSLDLNQSRGALASSAIVLSSTAWVQ